VTNAHVRTLHVCLACAPCICALLRICEPHICVRTKYCHLLPYITLSSSSLAGEEEEDDPSAEAYDDDDAAAICGLSELPRPPGRVLQDRAAHACASSLSGLLSGLR